MNAILNCPSLNLALVRDTSGIYRLQDAGSILVDTPRDWEIDEITHQAKAVAEFVKVVGNRVSQLGYPDRLAYLEAVTIPLPWEGDGLFVTWKDLWQILARTCSIDEIQYILDDLERFSAFADSFAKEMLISWSLDTLQMMSEASSRRGLHLVK